MFIYFFFVVVVLFSLPGQRIEVGRLRSGLMVHCEKDQAWESNRAVLSTLFNCIQALAA